MYCAKPALLPLTLCESMDCGPPGSSVHGIFQQEYYSGLPVPSPGANILVQSYREWTMNTLESHQSIYFM